MTEAELTIWLDAYKRAWEERNPRGVLALFTPDAEYAETPFGPTMQGHDEIRAYWAEATSAQDRIHFGYTILSADPAVSHWWCRYVVPSESQRVQLDGMFWLEFAEDGRCSSLKEWWHREKRPLRD